MRKLPLAFVLVLISSFSFGQIKKAAVISVYGSRNLSDNPLATKMYEAIMKDSSFNLKPIVDKFDKIITEKFLLEFPFPFMAKDQIVNAPGYKDLKQLTKWANESWFTTPAKDYVPIAAIGSFYDEKAILKSFEVLGSDVDAVLITYIDFKLYDAVSFGITTKKIRAYVNMIMIDKTGKKIFKLKEGALSDDGVIAFGGLILEMDKLKPMIESSSNNLLEDMKERLPKSLAKMAKKLNKN